MLKKRMEKVSKKEQNETIIPELKSVDVAKI